MSKKNKEYPAGWVDIPVDQLVKADWNYKGENPEKTKKLTENLKRNGLIQNLIVRYLDSGFYECVNGNHRLDVCYELGHETVHCFNLGKISTAAAQRVAVETNETNFESDTLKLAQLLREMGEEFNLDDLESTMPYNLDELQDFENLLDYEYPTTEDSPHPGEGDTPPEDDGQIKTVTITFTNNSNQEERAQFVESLYQFCGDYPFALVNGKGAEAGTEAS